MATVTGPYEAKGNQNKWKLHTCKNDFFPSFGKVHIFKLNKIYKRQKV